MVHVNALHGPACRQCRASWPVIIASSCSCIVQASYKPSPTFTHRSHKVHEDHEAGAAVEYKNIQPTFCVQSRLPQFWYRYFRFCDKCTILNTQYWCFHNLRIYILNYWVSFLHLGDTCPGGGAGGEPADCEALLLLSPAAGGVAAAGHAYGGHGDDANDDLWTHDDEYGWVVTRVVNATILQCPKKALKWAFKHKY